MTTTTFEGRTAFVTGAGRGIGREIALGLARAGAAVALVARTEAEIDAVAQEVDALGVRGLALPADIGDPAQARGAATAATANLGEVDILVNNAAVVTPLGPTPGLDPRAIEEAFAINVVAPITLSAAVLPAMVSGGWGRIVNVSSGVVAQPGMMIGGTVYAATKAALEAHTRNLAAELENTGVTVNAYRPGAVDTAMQEWIRSQPAGAIGAELRQRFATLHEAGELLAPTDAAAGLLDRIGGNDTGEIWSVS